MDEVKKMTPVEEFKHWWLKHEDEIIGWAFIGTVMFVTTEISYKLGYIRGSVDLANTFGNLIAENNS